MRSARTGRARPAPADVRAGAGAAPRAAVRDPWTWLTLAAVLPLAWRMAGAPWGEPVAEDFDFLHRALLQGMGSLLDGGGSQAFWRPVPHQLYYAALGPLLTRAPHWVTVFHLLVLGLAAALVQRALRPALGGPLSCVAASFALLGESVRTMAGWPTQFVDVGLYAASAAALHAATRGRHALALAALAVALLCKEVAVVTGVLLPLLPTAARSRRERARFAAGCAAVLAGWGATTAFVRGAAHLQLPQRIAQSPEALAAGPLERFAWTLDATLRAGWSLPRLPVPETAWALAGTLSLVTAATLVFVMRPAARERLVRTRAWLAWGMAWFALATLTLTPIYPSWQPNRHQHASLGLGVATTVFLGSAHPALAVANTALRLALLARAPGAVTLVEEAAPETGAFMDWPRLTRLQHFMRAARVALRREIPRLAPGSTVVQQNLPHGVEYAFGGDHALQVWYRTAGLHWMRFDEFRAAPGTAASVILEGDPGREPPVGLVRPDAMRALFEAQALAAAGRYTDMFPVLDRADSLQGSLEAPTFHDTSRRMRENARVALGLPAR